MPALPQLADLASYRPCDWDLKQDERGRQGWVTLFRTSLERKRSLYFAEFPDLSTAQFEAFQQDHDAAFAEIQDHPERFERVDVLALTRLGYQLRAKHGLADPYLHIRERENAVALDLLPRLLASLDRLPLEQQAPQLAEGLLAGNMFDLGSPETIKRYFANQTGFAEARAALPARPWWIDEVEPWQRDWNRERFRHVAFFVDNAGSDLILGAIPMTRWMLAQGARVTLVANSEPALNDITAEELTALMPALTAAAPELATAWSADRLAVVASGAAQPLLDLSDLSAACVSAISDADLIMLHGMGRSIESNFGARFRTASLKTAVVKDANVAQWLGCRLLDCRFAFAPGAG